MPVASSEPTQTYEVFVYEGDTPRFVRTVQSASYLMPVAFMQLLDLRDQLPGLDLSEMDWRYAPNADRPCEIAYLQDGTPLLLVKRRAIVDGPPDVPLEANGERYLRQAGAVCPFCHSSAIEAGPYDGEAGVVTSEVLCRDCRAVWVDCYHLERVRIHTLPALPAEREPEAGASGAETP